ncbi:APC family permease [Fusobacterium sp.]|uniref:APC family permease n=1 Tax=Fusobacterium sp. TaxID=68766 RepID=UPI00396CD023
MNEQKAKKIGLWNIVGLGVGGAVGSGIFVTLGAALAYTGRSILPVTVICAFYMLLAYWYNLGLSGIFVIEGGDYSMKGMLLPPLLTGFGGWANVIWAFGCTSYALAITSYLGDLWPQIQNNNTLVSTVILSLFFLLTIKGSRFVTLFQNAVTAMLVIALISFIIFGLPNVNIPLFFDSSYDGGLFYGGIAGLISAIAIMGWACQGSTMGPVGVVVVTKNPKKNIPLGIILSTVIVSIIYGLMSFVAAGILPYEQVANQNLSIVAREILPSGLFAFFVIGGGICAIMSSFLMVLVMIRYPLIHMANDGWLPPVFKKQTKDGYPYMCYLLVYIIALIPILTKMSVSNAISMLMIPTMLINVYLNAYCAKVPEKFPDQFAKRSLKISPGIYKLCSWLGSFCAGIIALTLFKELNFSNAVIALCIILFPLLFSWIALKKTVNIHTLNSQKEEILKNALSVENN